MDKSRVELTIFFIEKISFSLKLFSGHFMGNPSLRLSEVLGEKEHWVDSDTKHMINWDKPECVYKTYLSQ